MRILRVDLSNRKTEEQTLPYKMVWEHIGGKGIASFILKEEINPAVDPLGPGNKLIIAVGPLTGTDFPTADWYGVFFKSPLTEIYGESYAGGHAARRIWTSGYDVLVVERKADNATWLSIIDGEVEFNDAKELWGKTTHQTEDFLRRDVGSDIGVLTIGPAGENLVLFASIVNDYYHSASRCGSGAVMGSKNLKAIVFGGSREPLIKDETGFNEVVAEVSERIRNSKETNEIYPKYGTPFWVDAANELGVFPTRYWSGGVSKFLDQINAKAVIQDVLIEHTACEGCPIGCRKLCEVKTGPFTNAKAELEYETISSFGGLCDIGDIRAITGLADLCNKLGLDPMTSGNIVSFAIMLRDRGKIKTEPDLDYGSAEPIGELLKLISQRKDVGSNLANGVLRIAKRTGLENIAVHVKGLEPIGFDVRGLVGTGLSYAVASRGACHLRSHLFMQELIGEVDRYSYSGKSLLLIDNEDRIVIYDSLLVCHLIRKILNWDLLENVLASIFGVSIVKKVLKTNGSRIITSARSFNVECGVSRKDDNLPELFLEQPLPLGSSKGMFLDRREFEKLLSDYYVLRKWDNQGAPFDFS
ncbi:MAG: aldehyde ferredoxin oxidoreductase family protein [Candidatus Hodarchaeota archaeon]